MHCAKAPIRIGLAGGGTDTSPYSDIYGGAILNATVSLFAYATLRPRDDGKITFRAVDRDELVEACSEESLPTDGLLALHKGVYNRIVKDFAHKPLSFDLTTFVDAPAGSGMGTSSTLVVAIVGAFTEWLRLPLGEYDIAQESARGCADNHCNHSRCHRNDQAFRYEHRCNPFRARAKRETDRKFVSPAHRAHKEQPADVARRKKENQ